MVPTEVRLEGEVEDPHDRGEGRRAEARPRWRHERVEVPERGRMYGEDPKPEIGDEHGGGNLGGPAPVAATEPRVAPREPRGGGDDSEDGHEEKSASELRAERHGSRSIARRSAPRRDDLERDGPTPEGRGDDVQRHSAVSRHRTAEARDRIKGNPRKPCGRGHNERLDVEPGFGEKGVPSGRRRGPGRSEEHTS